MIFVHAGLRKTGSTSIQAAAAAKRFEGIRFSQRSVTELYLQNPSPSWLRRVVREAANRHVLLSNESFLHGQGEFGFPDVVSRVERLATALDPMPVKFIVYVRAHLPWIESNCFQEVQDGRPLDPKLFLDKFIESGACNLTQAMESIQSVVGGENLSVRVHHDQVDVVQDIASAMGVAVTGPEVLRTNYSLPNATIWTLSRVNSIDPSLCWPALDALRRSVDGASSGQRQSVLPAADQCAVIQQFESDWMGLAPFVSKQFEYPENVLRAAWEHSIAGRPLKQSTANDSTRIDAEELVNYFHSPLGYLDAHICRRLRNPRQLRHSLRWRMKMGL